MILRYLLVTSLLLAALLLPRPTHAQTGRFLWQTGIETRHGGEQARQMIRCRTGGYLICGSINDSITTIPSTYVVKVDEQGQKVWERRIDPDPTHQNEGMSIAENRSGQILVATRARDLTVTTFPYNYDARIDLLSATGQPIWHQTYNSPLADQFRKLKLGNDGNFVGLTSQLGLASVFKMDSTGQYIWQQAVVYDSTDVGYLTDLVPVVSGYVVVNSFYLNSPPYGWRGVFSRLNESGLELYRKPIPSGSFQVYRACVDLRGNLVFAHGWVSRTDAQLDALWTKHYASFGDALGLSALSDGNTLLLGQQNFGDYNLSLAKVAPNGQLIADTILWRFPGDETPIDVVEDALGNYVLCGNTTVGLTGGPAIILAKLRPWRQTVGLSEEPGNPASLAGLTPYPNPTHETVYLHGAAALRGALVLRDALGRAVRTFSLDASAADAPLSLAGLPAGLYLLQFTQSGGAAARTWRVVKQS